MSPACIYGRIGSSPVCESALLLLLLLLLVGPEPLQTTAAHCPPTTITITIFGYTHTLYKAQTSSFSLYLLLFLLRISSTSSTSQVPTVIKTIQPGDRSSTRWNLLIANFSVLTAKDIARLPEVNGPNTLLVCEVIFSSTMKNLRMKNIYGILSADWQD